MFNKMFVTKGIEQTYPWDDLNVYPWIIFAILIRTPYVIRSITNIYYVLLCEINLSSQKYKEHNGKSHIMKM